jgi:hypothetical protein
VNANDAATLGQVKTLIAAQAQQIADLQAELAALKATAP